MFFILLQTAVSAFLFCAAVFWYLISVIIIISDCHFYCLLDAAYTYLCRIDTLFYIELCFHVAFRMFFVILISGYIFFGFI